MKMLKLSPAAYGVFLIVIAGFGGLLYGIDLGVISAALLYLSKTINLTLAQTSAIVAAVLGGSMVSSLVAGLLADWLGRKRIMVISGVMFLASVVQIALSQGLHAAAAWPAVAGYERRHDRGCDPAVPRGVPRGTDQGTRHGDLPTSAYLRHCGCIHRGVAGTRARQRHRSLRPPVTRRLSWRRRTTHGEGMFLATIYPGLIFLAGTLLLIESPRWLYRKRRTTEAALASRGWLPDDEAELQLAEMEAIDRRKARPGPQATQKTRCCDGNTLFPLCWHASSWPVPRRPA